MGSAKLLVADRAAWRCGARWRRAILAAKREYTAPGPAQIEPAGRRRSGLERARRARTAGRAGRDRGRAGAWRSICACTAAARNQGGRLRDSARARARADRAAAGAGHRRAGAAHGRRRLDVRGTAPRARSASRRDRRPCAARATPK